LTTAEMVKKRTSQQYQVSSRQGEPWVGDERR